MTIVTTVRCDNFGCSSETEAESNFHSDIRAEGYHEDPAEAGTHYCAECWPTVKAELEKENQQ